MLTALADAMIEEGNYDSKELSKFIEQRCASDEDARDLPMELLREYHVKHKLPLDSAMRLLGEARSRIDQEWTDDVTNEKDEKAKKRSALYLSYRKIQTYILEGRVLMQHGEANKALAALEKAHGASVSFPSDIVITDGEGKELRTLGSGLLDDLHVLTAAALLELGRVDEAKEAFSRASASSTTSRCARSTRTRARSWGSRATARRTSRPRLCRRRTSRSRTWTARP